jgi:hypothetical protein
MISRTVDHTLRARTRDESIDIEPTPSVFRSFVEILVRIREAPGKYDFAHHGCRDNEKEKAEREVRRHFAPIKDKDKRQNELSVSLSYIMLLSADGGFLVSKMIMSNDLLQTELLQLHMRLALIHRKSASHFNNRMSRLCRDAI